MKIQLDTVAKTIKVEGTVNLGELTRTLERLLPNDMWKEFQLETYSVINWTTPIIIPPANPYPPYPWIIYTKYDSTPEPYRYSLESGTYNIQI